MARNPDGLSFAAKIFGLNALKLRFAGLLEASRQVFGRKKIENLLLEKTLQRFEPQGANPAAQKDPEGVPWVPITDRTVALRKVNKRKTQALVDEGDLRAAVQIIRTNLKVALAGRQGRALVGIPGTSPMYQIGVTMQQGTGNVPARPFIGVSEDDQTAVQKFINRVYGRALR